ncbi:unnamed protein product [Eruca vesicaria subsp. sativa]|uniref:Uncharacterized protein n=1 Tax=Eruca vesicaria subsp. sativa TaxID=29727 RepID=A0ABC8K2K8_ERUVS|nr:unnamed protein product [Eruca vesicaria subsp. sativa]
MDQEISKSLLMDLVANKPLSEFDKKLALIESAFQINYGLWFKGIPVDSSAATPDSNGKRSKTSRVETTPKLPEQPIRGFVNE